MNELDPLRPLLREWQAPEPGAAMDARIAAAWHAARPRSRWRRLWTARISIPVPVLTALLLVIVALLIALRPTPRAVPPEPGYVTRLGAAGFEPLPEGAARVVRTTEVKQ